MDTIYLYLFLNKLSDVYPLHNIDLDKNVAHIKNVIAKELNLEIAVNELEVCCHGKVLNDIQTLRSAMKPKDSNLFISCFLKTKSYVLYEPPAADINTKHIQELFSLTSHLQISVASRVNILHKILAEFPQFRRNLGAQSLIRDSVLFNTLHEPEVVQNLVREYPLICESAPFIVDTIRKELARNSSATQFQEQAASESTTSSEEENSLGAGSSSSGGSTSAANRREELANIRQISRQQLANALARVDMGSFNSLSNIAQRNVDEALHGDRPRTTSAPNSTTSSTAITTATERTTISSELFRSELARAFQSLQQQGSPSADVSTSDRMLWEQPSLAEPMVHDGIGFDDDDSGPSDNNDVLPRCYRQHRFTEQLRTMAAMGFINHTQNANYLTMTDGNVEQAINLLMLSLN